MKKKINSMNLFMLFQNRPDYEIGQIWHCSSLSEDVVITALDKDYLKKGIIRCVFLDRGIYLNDGNDVVIYPTTKHLKTLYGLPRIVLRVTDGPLLTEDLFVCKGILPKKKINQILESLKKRPNLDKFQEKYMAKRLKAIEYLRTKVLKKEDL